MRPWWSRFLSFGRIAIPPAARSTASVIHDAMRCANAAHGYPLALREADATEAAALRRILRHGA
jgi:hypothetical protein